MSADINNLGAGSAGSNFIQGPASINAPSQAAGEKQSPLSKSTIQQSEIEALVSMLAAGFPYLPPPQSIASNFNDLSGTGSVSGVTAAGVTAAAITTLGMQTEQTKNDIITTMWKSFQEGVDEMAKRSKEEYEKKWTIDADKGGPKGAAEYFAFLMAVSANQRSDEINNVSGGTALAVQMQGAFNNWMVAPVQPGDSAALNGITGNSPAYPSSAFIAGSLIVGNDMIRQGIGGVSHEMGVQLSISPVADALQAVGPTSGLPADSQAAAAMIAALLGSGSALKTTNDTIAQGAANGQPPQGLDFAVNYAQNIMSIVTHNVQADEALPPERADQNRMVRLMLATMALNMVYRAGYGGMAGTEIRDILNPNNPTALANIDPSIKGIITQLRTAILNNLPEDEAGTLASIADYVDQKNSVESMLSDTNLLTGILTENQTINNQQLGTTSV